MLMASGNTFRDFIFDTVLGKKSGYEQQLLIGVKDAQQIATGSQTIWDLPTSITFLTVETELFLSSTSVADTVQLVAVEGTDANFDRKTTFTVLTGQTQASAGTFFRVYRATVIAPQAGAAGDIYLATSGTTTGGVPDDLSTAQSKITAGKNTTHNGFFTVPAGKVAVTMAIRGTTDSPTKASTVDTIIDFDGGIPPLNTVTYSFSTGLQEFTFPTPIATSQLAGQLIGVLDEKATIEFRSSVNTNNTTTFFGVDYILVPREEVGITGL